MADELLREAVVMSYSQMSCLQLVWPVVTASVPFLCLDLLADFLTGIQAAPLSSSPAPELDLWFCADLSSW